MARVATIYSESFPAIDPRVPCQLVVVEGPDRGRAQRIGRDDIVIGTDVDCGLVLTDDRASAFHVRVADDDHGGYIIVDLDSTNGTFFEGSRIAQASIPVGASLKIGHSVVRLQPIPVALEVTPSQSRRFGELVGQSLVMRELFAVLELAAQSDATVLLQGETGSGKELAARALHDQSSRRAGPFVAVDCGALPEGVIDSELFGHVRGAFTGAVNARAGLFARASGGTLFLDELDSIPLGTQARLLRALEERAVRPVGSDDVRAFDVRLVAACHAPLDRQVAEGRFRADLYYRISVLAVDLPPLRSRREDLAILVTELLRRRGISAGAVEGPGYELLAAHQWPGNVRELRNVLERALALTPGATSFAELRMAVGPSGSLSDSVAVRSDLPFAEAKQAVLQSFERRYLQDLFARERGNVSATARAAGLDRKHTRTLLRRYGLLDSDGDADD